MRELGVCENKGYRFFVWKKLFIIITAHDIISMVKKSSSKIFRSSIIITRFFFVSSLIILIEIVALTSVSLLHYLVFWNWGLVFLSFEIGDDELQTWIFFSRGSTNPPHFKRKYLVRHRMSGSICARRKRTGALTSR